MRLLQWLVWTFLFVNSSLVFAALEVGSDDFRVTSLGGNGDTFAFAARQDMAYNSTDDEFFVVFLGRTSQPPLAVDEIEMFGQRLSASGAPIGQLIRLSSIGGLGSAGETPGNRRIVYDPSRNGYIVVYNAIDSDFGSDSLDIYGVLLDANGQPGAPFVIDDAVSSNARPDIAVNTVDNEFTVVWERASDSARTIQARRYASGGVALGAPFRVDTIDGFKSDPSIAYGPDENHYLVAWRRNIESPKLQLLTASGGTVLAQERDYATPGFFTSRSSIAYNPDLAEFLIVFAHSDPAAGVVQEAYEMFGRRVDRNGVPQGAGKFRISYSAFTNTFARTGANIDCGPGGQCLEVARAGVTYSQADRSYVVAWSGDVAIGDDRDTEAFIRFIPGGADPAPQSGQEQISNMGGNDLAYIALHPSVAAKPSGYLSTWWGDDNQNGGVDGEFELWGQNLASDGLFRDGFETP